MSTEETALILLEVAVGIVVGFVVFTYVQPYLVSATTATQQA